MEGGEVGRVAVITGATGGMGAAVAKALSTGRIFSRADCSFDGKAQRSGYAVEGALHRH